MSGEFSLQATARCQEARARKLRLLIVCIENAQLFQVSIEGWLITMRPVTIGIAALGYVCRGVRAKALVWEVGNDARQWTPAEQTLGALLQAVGEIPEPTPAPKGLPRRELNKRVNSLCGYADGTGSE